jgi:hypothetical protein
MILHFFSESINAVTPKNSDETKKPPEFSEALLQYSFSLSF